MISIAGVPKRIGLALSGGGFRAAAFHLGVMEELERLNLLSTIDLLTCVSGGSIAGATVALHWHASDKLQVLRQYLTTRSVAVSSFVGGVLDPFETRLGHLARSYDRHLFNGATLAALTARAST